MIPNPADRNLSIAQLDRKYTAGQLRSMLMSAGRLSVGATPTKPALVRMYSDALHADNRQTDPVGPSNVRVIKRVELDGKGCSGLSGHTVAFEHYEGGIRIYADADEGEDSDKFHTTLADLKAAVAALEAGQA